MRTLIAQPLSSDAFRPFGDVLAFDAGAARTVNHGTAQRADLAASFQADSGAPVLSIYRAKAQPLPQPVPSLERHPHSSQTFLALSVSRFLVVVAPADGQGAPDLSQACAFVGAEGQGINYRQGLWHAPIVALDGDGDFLMFMWERGDADDCIVHDKAIPLQVSLEHVKDGAP